MALHIILRRVGLFLWVLAAGLLAALIYYPVETMKLRAALVGLAAFVWFGFMVITWRRRFVRGLMVLITTICAAFLLLPERESYDRDALTKEYLAALQRYEGAPYVWGGEKLWGIDCSGLMRRALGDALIVQGVRTLNPALIRQAVRLWWGDTTASNLGQGRGGAKFLFETPSINTLDHAQIRPGDMAVTQSGVHILGYLGDRTWIEADPAAQKVLIAAAPSEAVLWFKGPMKMVRWEILE